jgi:hypothetical protein
MHSTDPAYIVARLNWLLQDLIDDERGLSTMELRNVLAGRHLNDPLGEVLAA